MDYGSRSAYSEQVMLMCGLHEERGGVPSWTSICFASVDDDGVGKDAYLLEAELKG